MHSESAWSQLDTKPVILYSKSSDAYIAYWCGIAMTARQALCIASVIYFNVWPSPKMKHCMLEEFVNIYYSNGFKTRAWDLILKSFNNGLGANHHYRFLYKKVYDSLCKNDKNEIKKVNPKEVLSWFKKDNAIIVD